MEGLLYRDVLLRSARPSFKKILISGSYPKAEVYGRLAGLKDDSPRI